MYLLVPTSGSMAAVAAEAINEVAELFSAYRHQIEDNLEDFIRNSQDTLAEASTQIETVTAADSTTDELITAVKETVCCSKGRSENLVSYNNKYLQTEVDTPKRAVVEIYAWASITTAGSMIGTFLGYTLFAPFLQYFVGTLTAAVLGYFILPLGTHFFLRSVRFSIFS